MLMPQINNNEVLLKLAREAKIQTSAERVPNQLAEKVVPVLNVNPDREIQIRSADAIDAASATLYTTHAIKDTYLIGAQLTVAKDAVSDSIFSQLQITPKGKSATSLIFLRYEPTTAGQFFEEVSLSHPILLARSAVVSLVNNAATASIDTTGVIYFYEVETESG